MDIEVRLVHTGQVVHTIRTDGDYISCITPVPGHSELFVIGHGNGDVHLLDIEKGACACECMNVNAGVHVRQIVQLEKWVTELAASSTRLLCTYEGYKKVAKVHFDEKN